MKKIEKIDYLQENHLREWVETRAKVEQELSDAHDIFNRVVLCVFDFSVKVF